MKHETFIKKPLYVIIFVIFVSLSFNSMAKKINNIALTKLPIHGIGTQQPISEGKGNIICGIYKITSPSQKIYIGQSINIYNRWNEYRRNKCKGQRKLYYSFQKYGFDKHRFEVLQQCTIEELNNLEIYYIELFQCFNSKYGLNLMSGGNRPLLSEETKNIIRNKMIGTSHAKGYKWTNQHRINYSLKRKNIKHSVSHVEKLKKRWAERKLLPDKIITTNRILLDMETGVFYNSIQEASDILCINYDTLYECLKGKRKRRKLSLKIV